MLFDDEAYCLPATTNERGEIDCLHPKANHQPDLVDEFYRQELTDDDYKELMREIYKLSPLGWANRQVICYATRAIVRFEKRNHQRCIIAITPHYFIALEENKQKTAPPPDKKQKGPPPKPTKYVRLCFFHVLHIKKMYFGTNYQSVRFFMIRLVSLIDPKTKQKYKPKVTIEANDVLAFAYNTIRNHCLAHSTSYALNYMEMPEELRLDPETDHPELFPRFDARLSPSEMFQFSYFAICSNEKQKYVHDVVRYFHHQVINHNGIFNVGHLPFRFYPERSRSHSELIPIFRALIYIPYMFGIVCHRFDRPDVLYAISFQLRKTRALRFLYLSDCGATNGLSEVSRALDKNPDAPIEYIDFSKNRFTDFVGFFNYLFKNRKIPIWYLNFNYCGMTDYNVIELFTSLQNNECSWGVKYLHIAGSEVLDESIKRMEGYLSAVTKTGKQSLISLDISDVKQNVNKILFLLKIYPMPLRALYLANDQLDKSTYELLCYIIENSHSLSILDISNTGLNAEQVANIICLMSNRPKYLQLHIFINKLNLNGTNLIAVVKGFLNGDITQWRKIFMESNNMSVPDLQLLTALFTRMPNLKELSLSDNFDNSMDGIDYELPDILRIRNLEILHIGGGKNKFLGLKILPLLFAIGLSYEIRSYIGGYPARENIPPLNQMKDTVADILEAFLDTPSLCPTSSVEDVDELKERVGEMVIPYLIAQSALAASADLVASPQGKMEMMKRLIPLLKLIAEKHKFSDKSQQYTKFFGAHVLPMINFAHDHFKDPKLTEQLSEKLPEMVNQASKLCALRQLDIKNNKISDIGVKAVIELFTFNTELRNVDIDGSKITTITLMSDFVTACEKNENLTRQQFPLNDAKRIIRTAKVNVQEVVERELAYSQYRLSRAVDAHRARVGEFTDLPFDIVPELEKLIERRMEDIVKYLPSTILRDHSGVVEEFKLMLPYLDEDGADNTLPDTYRVEEIGQQELYKTPSMRKRFIEGDGSEKPLQFLAYELRRNQNGNRGELTDAFDTSAAPFDNEQIMRQRNKFPEMLEEEEDEGDFQEMDIQQIINEMQNKHKVSDDEEVQAFDEVPNTQQFDLPGDFPAAINSKRIHGGNNNIDLDDDDGVEPIFYEGDNGKEETNRGRSTRKGSRVKKLDSKANINLRRDDLDVQTGGLQSNVKAPDFD